MDAEYQKLHEFKLKKEENSKKNRLFNIDQQLELHQCCIEFISILINRLKTSSGNLVKTEMNYNQLTWQ